MKMIYYNYIIILYVMTMHKNVFCTEVYTKLETTGQSPCYEIIFDRSEEKTDDIALNNDEFITDNMIQSYIQKYFSNDFELQDDVSSLRAISSTILTPVATKIDKANNFIQNIMKKYKLKKIHATILKYLLLPFKKQEKKKSIKMIQQVKVNTTLEAVITNFFKKQGLDCTDIPHQLYDEFINLKKAIYLTATKKNILQEHDYNELVTKKLQSFADRLIYIKTWDYAMKNS